MLLSYIIITSLIFITSYVASTTETAPPTGESWSFPHITYAAIESDTVDVFAPILEELKTLHARYEQLMHVYSLTAFHITDDAILWEAHHVNQKIYRLNTRLEALGFNFYAATFEEVVAIHGV